MIFGYLKGANTGVTADKALSYPSLCKAQYKTVKNNLTRSFPNFRVEGEKVSFGTNSDIEAVRFPNRAKLGSQMQVCTP